MEIRALWKGLIGFGVAVVLTALALASVALGASHAPKGEYAQFKECPLSRVTITDCIYAVTSGGAFTIGKKTVPIVNPVILQGGAEGASEAVTFFGAENGDTLSKTPQPVPGGLLGIGVPMGWPKSARNWFDKQIDEGVTAVTATVELAGPTKGLTNIKLNTERLLTRDGTALGLPVKIKLSNAILGSNCYIGSAKNPILLNFTTGKSGSLEGLVGEVTFNEAFTIVQIAGGRLVNGAYAAPAASGCGGSFSSLVDPLVNLVLGTPSPPGKNKAVLVSKLQDAQSEAVRNSE